MIVNIERDELGSPRKDVSVINAIGNVQLEKY